MSSVLFLTLLFPSKIQIGIYLADIDLSCQVTSPVKWPFDTPGAISYTCPVVTESVSPGPNILRSRTWPFKVTWRHRSRDQSIRHMPFPIGDPLKPRLYLQLFSRYSAPSPVCAHTDRQSDRHTDTHCQWFIFCPMQYTALDIQKSKQKLAPKSTLRTQTAVVPMKLQASQTTPLICRLVLDDRRPDWVRFMNAEVGRFYNRRTVHCCRLSSAYMSQIIGLFVLLCNDLLRRIKHNSTRCCCLHR